MCGCEVWKLLEKLLDLIKGFGRLGDVAWASWRFAKVLLSMGEIGDMVSEAAIEAGGV